MNKVLHRQLYAYRKYMVSVIYPDDQPKCADFTFKILKHAD